MYLVGGISPLETCSTTSPKSGWGLSHSEKSSAPRPSSTSCWTSQDAGATFEYQRHLVRLLWQS